MNELKDKHLRTVQYRVSRASNQLNTGRERYEDAAGTDCGYGRTRTQNRTPSGMDGVTRLLVQIWAVLQLKIP